MKKNFSLIVPNKNPDRQVDSIKYEIKKYIARERRKKLPENVDYWDFDCRIGINSEQAVAVHVGNINASISKLAEEKNEYFYLEILVKQAFRKNKKKTSEKITTNDQPDYVSLISDKT